MPDQPPVVDALGRTPLAGGMKRQIEEAFKVVPPGKKGALLVIADERGARAHLAANVNGSWKVAGGGGVAWKDRKPEGWVGVMGSW